jgi:hypothetical protein
MSVLDQTKKLEAEIEALKKKKDALKDSAKAELLAEADKIITELNALGFSYRLSEGSSSSSKERKTKDSDSRTKQLTDSDIRNLKVHFLNYLKSKKDNPQTATEIFSGLNFPESRFQTYGKHLKALLTGGHIEETVKDKTKTKSPRNPAAYLWVKDLDD